GRTEKERPHASKPHGESLSPFSPPFAGRRCPGGADEGWCRAIFAIQHQAQPPLIRPPATFSPLARGEGRRKAPRFKASRGSLSPFSPPFAGRRCPGGAD